MALANESGEDWRSRLAQAEQTNAGMCAVRCGGRCSVQRPQRPKEAQARLRAVPRASRERLVLLARLRQRLRVLLPQRRQLPPPRLRLLGGRRLRASLEARLLRRGVATG